MVSYEQWNNECWLNYPQIIPYAIGKDNGWQVLTRNSGAGVSVPGAQGQDVPATG